MSTMPVDKKSANFAEMLLNTQVNNNNYSKPIVEKQHKRSVSETKKKYVASSQNWTCKKCHEKLEATFEVDHVIELQDGGTNNIDNLVALCRNCHGKKGMFRKILN
jgi:5-methylcytosine-specific restriction endonuclease McrA